MTDRVRQWVPAQRCDRHRGRVTAPVSADSDRLAAQRPAPSRAFTAFPGVLLAATIAVAATVVGRAVPLIGGPVAGIVLGVALSAVARRRSRFAAGLAWAAARLLQVAVALLGAQLGLREVARVGLGSLPVMLGTLTVCLALAHLLGRWLGIERDLRTLIGVGTGICGASAIATVSPVIRARGSDVAYAVTTIFVFNIAAVLSFPAIGHLLGLSQHAFGLFAGTAVNDTSSVVAAATSYGATAANYAVVVKLTRTLMIIPVTLALGALTQRRVAAPASAGRAGVARQLTRLVPWFLVGFLLLAAANSAALIPAAVRVDLASVSTFLITTALVAIGMRIDPAAIRRAGTRPLLLGALLWLAVAVTSLSLQAVTGRL